MKKIKRKLLPKLLISWTLTFNISATECPIEIKFSILDSTDQARQHITLYRKSKLIAKRTTIKDLFSWKANQNCPQLVCVFVVHKVAQNPSDFQNFQSVSPFDDYMA